MGRDALVIGTLLVFSSLLLGCGGGKHDARLNLSATKSLNADEGGGPHPCVVRVYHLTGKDKFEKASFKDLWKSDEKVLEKDLVERNEITLVPDSTVPMDLKVDTNRGTEYLGVIALFLKPEGETWRTVIPARLRSWVPFKTPTVRIIVDKNTVTVSDQ